jgi:large subunit ribosomal protein L28
MYASKMARVLRELWIDIFMAKRCELCGKGPVVGRNISHAHNVTPRRFEPNLQRVRALVNGGVRRLRVCTRCLRSNKVVKAA